LSTTIGQRFALQHAFSKGAALGLLVGALYWLLLWGYLYGSDHAWWTGAPSTLGSDWRMVLARAGLSPPYWQLPAACMVLGAVFGLLAQGLRVNTQSVWQAFRFGGISASRNWYWMLAVLLLPLSNMIAAFFTGHQHAYDEPAERFRPQWRFPGWLALLLCLVVSASMAFADIFVPQRLLEAITTRVPEFLVALALLIFTSIFDAIGNQLCAGVWLERCAGLAAIRPLLARILRPACIINAVALGVLLALFASALLLPPIFFASVFLIYEAPQLEANMRSTGMTAPAAFLWCTHALGLLRTYGWLFVIAPIGVFVSICNAKLFQQTYSLR
jgi:hypothetical protein